jgi:putative nucleotidyltransferase with HDIG domain
MDSQATLATGAAPRPPPPPDPAHIARRIQALPQISTAALELSEELGSPRSDANDLERILKGDPALATNVLRLANSAAFRGVKGASTLRDAVVRLGRRGLQGLAAGAALRGALPKSLDGYGQSAKEFLRHSVGVATLAERISRLVQFVDRDVIFTAGLLHDVGKLVVSTYLVDSGVVLERDEEPGDEGGQSPEAERGSIGIDHCAVGLEVSMAWRLPHAAMIVSRWHHDPLNAPDPVSRKLACVVHLADQIDRLLFKDAVSIDDCLVAPAVFERLGLKPAVMGELAGAVMEEIEAMCDALAV